MVCFSRVVLAQVGEEVHAAKKDAKLAYFLVVRSLFGSTPKFPLLFRLSAQGEDPRTTIHVHVRFPFMHLHTQDVPPKTKVASQDEGE